MTGLVKALRANKKDEQKVINSALDEIRLEVKASDWDVKGAAILKLIYLEMLGHHHILSYSFNVLECMACPKFHIKQIGYLAAAQSFGSSTEVILLANNLIKKDLQSSSHPSTVILALTSLPSLLVASPQLAQDLLNDLVKMLSSHSKPTVRRIATLTIGKIWCSHVVNTDTGGDDDDYNPTIQPSPATPLPIEFSHLEKLRSGLADQDSSVVSATVNIMLELARTRQDSLQSLLSLAPELFDLLTNSSNNWMLIKIAKLVSLKYMARTRRNDSENRVGFRLTDIFTLCVLFFLLSHPVRTVNSHRTKASQETTTPSYKPHQYNSSFLFALRMHTNCNHRRNAIRLGREFSSCTKLHREVIVIPVGSRSESKVYRSQRSFKTGRQCTTYNTSFGDTLR